MATVVKHQFKCRWRIVNTQDRNADNMVKMAILKKIRKFFRDLIICGGRTNNNEEQGMRSLILLTISSLLKIVPTERASLVFNFFFRNHDN